MRLSCLGQQMPLWPLAVRKESNHPAARLLIKLTTAFCEPVPSKVEKSRNVADSPAVPAVQMKLTTKKRLEPIMAALPNWQFFAGLSKA
jgi:hypothetical protein